MTIIGPATTASQPTVDQSLGHRAVRGALWQVLGGGWQTLVSLGASLYLARALRPEDYGIFGMALLVRTFIGTLGSLSMSSGVIVKKDVTQRDLSTCFWTTGLVKFLLFLICFFSAPVGAFFLREPRIEPILRVVAFLFLTSLIDNIPSTLLNKELHFGLINLVQGIAAVFNSALAVCLVLFANLQYWALVWAMMASTVGTSVAIFALARWHPTFEFDKNSFKYMFNFGINGLGFSITNYLSQNLDYLLVGRLLGAKAYGLYQFAYSLPHLVLDQVSRPVSSVVFPVFAKMRDENERLFRAYLAVVRSVCLVTFPLVIGLAGVADVAVPVLWGVRWLPIIMPLRILAVRAALTCVPQPIGIIFLCKDRPDLQFKLQVLSLAWTALSVSVLGYFYGLTGVAYGMLLAVVASMFILWKGLRLINASLRPVFAELSPVFVSALLCGLSAWLCAKWLTGVNLDNIAVLLLAVAAGAFVYFATLLVIARSQLLAALALAREHFFRAGEATV